MKKFRDLSINLKMPLIVGITGLVVMAVVCTLLIFSQRREAYDNTTKAIQLSAALSAASIAEYINSAAVIPRTFANVAAGVIQSKDIPDYEKRERLLEELRFFIAADERVDNVWAIFGPNAIDGLDETFVNHPGNNSNGVFMPWMIKGQLRVVSEQRMSLFDLAKEAGQEVFTNAYLYNLYGSEEHIVSLCIPVIVGSEMIGVVGMDFPVAQLNDIAVSFDISWRGRLVSSEGVIVIHANPERIGAIVGDGHRATLDGLARGRNFDLMVHFRGNDEYQAFIHVNFAGCKKNWFYGVSIPANEIYTASKKNMIYLIFITLLGALLISGVGFILIRWMLKDVDALNSTIDKLSLGQISQQIQGSKSGDEIGTMKNKLFQFVGALKRTVIFADNIGHGKLDAEYQMLSEGDELGQSLLEMRERLQKAETDRAIRVKEEEQRNWSTEGLAKFAEILRQDNNNLEALSYNVISNMVKYLDANQGGIFI